MFAVQYLTGRGTIDGYFSQLLLIRSREKVVHKITFICMNES